MQDSMEVRVDDLSSAPVRELLAYHLAEMHAVSPPGSVFALDFSGLQAPGVTVWTVWTEAKPVGVGALKDLGGGAAEIKSMRTHPDHLRKGVARILLEHIIGEARRRSICRLSLETGSGPAFDSALALYRSRGFVNGGAFSDYEQSAFNQFLHLEFPDHDQADR